MCTISYVLVFKICGCWKMTESEKYPVYKNRFAAEAKTGSVSKPRCRCLTAQYYGRGWPELKLHREQQDRDARAWHRLLQLVDDAIKDQRTEFSIGRELEPGDWAQIVTLPASISKLKSVKRFNLYGSSLVRIPPEIGQMSNLEQFDPYTSYRLHWFPYEITRCSKLKDSTVSTRAIYGNYKYRAAFPRLPDLVPEQIPATCSVCDQTMDASAVHQVWVSISVATDVLPLLVHACSTECLERLPKGASGHVGNFHQGGLDLIQPPVDSPMNASRIRKIMDKALAESSPDRLQNELAWLAGLAIRYGLPKSLDEIIDAGLDVSEEPRPLFSAIKNRDLETAQRLVDLGAPIDGICNDKTPLVVAVSTGYLAGVQFLLDLGVNAFGHDGKSTMSFIELCEAGLEKSAKTKGPAPDAVREEYESVVELLKSLAK